MYELNLADHIAKLRHERKITQEELADFLGVTKASVSKWENAQSTPDLQLLIHLAAFFDVTVDELLGYEPQLSGEQIRRCYAELSGDFVKLPFEEVLEKIRSLAHKYYSCYPLLLELVILYWNHHMLAETEERKNQILEEAVIWCRHILKNCKDVGMCSDALVLKAGLDLQLGRAAEAMEALEPISDPCRLAGQDGSLLVQAYQMLGKQEKAKSYVQVKQYLDLLNLIGNSILSLALYENDFGRCEETIHRITKVMEQYHLQQIHPNLAAQFYYQSAIVYAQNGKNENAVDALRSFEKCISELLKGEQIVLHGDSYFDLLDTWIERLPLGDMSPRNQSLVRQSVQGAFSHPAFEGIKTNREFQRLVYRMSKGGEEHA